MLFIYPIIQLKINLSILAFLMIFPKLVQLYGPYSLSKNLEMQ